MDPVRRSASTPSVRPPGIEEHHQPRPGLCGAGRRHVTTLGRPGGRRHRGDVRLPRRSRDRGEIRSIRPARPRSSAVGDGRPLPAPCSMPVYRGRPPDSSHRSPRSVTRTSCVDGDDQLRRRPMADLLDACGRSRCRRSRRWASRVTFPSDSTANGLRGGTIGVRGRPQQPVPLGPAARRALHGRRAARRRDHDARLPALRGHDARRDGPRSVPTPGSRSGVVHRRRPVGVPGDQPRRSSPMRPPPPTSSPPLRSPAVGFGWRAGRRAAPRATWRFVDVLERWGRGSTRTADCDRGVGHGPARGRHGRHGGHVGHRPDAGRGGCVRDRARPW